MAKRPITAYAVSTTLPNPQRTPRHHLLDVSRAHALSAQRAMEISDRDTGLC